MRLSHSFARLLMLDIDTERVLEFSFKCEQNNNDWTYTNYNSVDNRRKVCKSGVSSRTTMDLAICC